MRDASGRLFQSLFDAYDDKWDGAEDLGAVVEVSLRDHCKNIYTKTEKVILCQDIIR